MAGPVRLTALPSFQRDLHTLPNHRTLKMVLDMLLRVRDGQVRGIRLDPRVAPDRLGECYRLYFDPDGSGRFRYRLVYRCAPDEITAIALEALPEGEEYAPDDARGMKGETVRQSLSVVVRCLTGLVVGCASIAFGLVALVVWGSSTSAPMVQIIGIGAIFPTDSNGYRELILDPNLTTMMILALVIALLYVMVSSVVSAAISRVVSRRKSPRLTWRAQARQADSQP